MNCSQVQKFLPLHAGRELSGKREQLIAAHLQTCAACAAEADEYREARETLRAFALPDLSDEVYAEMRTSVWRRIEAESHHPSLFASITAWFQPRLVWAAAVAMFVIVTGLGLYFFGKGPTGQPRLTANNPNAPVRQERGSHEAAGGSTLNPEKKNVRPRQANTTRRPRKLDRMVAPDRTDTLVAYSPDAASQTSARSAGTDNLDPGRNDSGKTLRMEIQTNNPNIRIIWFTQTPNQ